jgi:hypothetical protein
MCFGTAHFFAGDRAICSLLVLGGLVPTVAAAAGFVRLSVTRVEKLQSEDYQIRHEALQLLGARERVTQSDVEVLKAVLSQPDRPS